jgi:hypothetical protein
MSQMPATTEATPAAPEAWGAGLVAAGCARCGAAHVLPQHRAAGPCLACFSGEVTHQPFPDWATPPERVLEFHVSPAAAAHTLERWASAVWLRPSELAGGALAARLRRVFVPMYLVDAAASGEWQAQLGFDYQVASTRESFRDGQWATQRQEETRIRWEPRAGTVLREYDNVAVPALEAHARLARGLGDFDAEGAVGFTPAALAGAAVRLPSLDPEAAWPVARARLEAQVAADCQVAAGAQHVERAQLRLAYASQHWTMLLLPVYVTAYRDDDGQWQVVRLNGRTGQVSGVRRASLRQGWMWSGTLAGLALALFLIALLLGAGGALLPPLLALSGILMIVALALGLSAFVPVAWAWQHNAQQAPAGAER